MSDKLKDFLNTQISMARTDDKSKLDKLWEKRTELTESLLNEYGDRMIEYSVKAFRPDETIAETKEILRNAVERLKQFPEYDDKNGQLIEKSIAALSKIKGEDFYYTFIARWARKFYQQERRQKKALKSFLSPEYSPPNNPFKIMEHLILLDLFYSKLAPNMPHIPLTVALCIDLTMMKLIQVTTFLSYDLDETGKERERVFGSIKRTDKMKKDREQIALRLFYQMEAKDMKGKSASRLYDNIADQIKEKIEKLGKDARKKYPFKKRPDRKTIERYLLSDEKIKNTLKKMGIIKDKCNV